MTIINLRPRSLDIRLSFCQLADPDQVQSPIVAYSTPYKKYGSYQSSDEIEQLERVKKRLLAYSADRARHSAV